MRARLLSSLRKFKKHKRSSSVIGASSIPDSSTQEINKEIKWISTMNSIVQLTCYYWPKLFNQLPIICLHGGRLHFKLISDTMSDETASTSLQLSSCVSLGCSYQIGSQSCVEWDLLHRSHWYLSHIIDQDNSETVVSVEQVFCKIRFFKI